jgi:hypothetical protein
MSNFDSVVDNIRKNKTNFDFFKKEEEIEFYIVC